MKNVPYKTFGFVIKRFLPYKNKYTIFTLTQGKIDITPTQALMRERLHVGMGIVLSLSRTNASPLYFASDVEIVNSALFQNKSLLQWVHRLAELCYYFLPREQCNVDVFIFFKRLFECMEHSAESSLWNHEGIHYLCISYFLKLFGFIPITEIEHLIHFFEEELFVSVDIQKDKAVEFFKKITLAWDISHMNFVKSWVYDCLLTHPYAHNFKTFGALDVPKTMRNI